MKEFFAIVFLVFYVFFGVDCFMMSIIERTYTPISMYLIFTLIVSAIGYFKTKQ